MLNAYLSKLIINTYNIITQATNFKIDQDTMRNKYKYFCLNKHKCEQRVVEILRSRD